MVEIITYYTTDLLPDLLLEEEEEEAMPGRRISVMSLHHPRLSFSRL